VNEAQKDPMFEIFVSEAKEIVSSLERIFIELKEGNRNFDVAVAEALRFFHTLKGSSAMMGFDDISKVCHRVEDIFVCMRDEGKLPTSLDTFILDMLNLIDFLTIQINRIENSQQPQDAENIEEVLEKVEMSLAENDKMQAENEKRYHIRLLFEEGWEMENLRAFLIIQNLKQYVKVLEYLPSDIESNMASSEKIKKEGFFISIETLLKKEDVVKLFESFAWVRDIKVEEVSEKASLTKEISSWQNAIHSTNKLINVNIEKVDKLIDLIGEVVITFSMIVQHQEIKTDENSSFKNLTLQMSKLIRELQEVAMSMRMLPLSSTFQRLKRTIIEMSAKLQKHVDVHITGEETELDKVLIEHLTDPLIHIVRNAVDHGIEDKEERLKKGKGTTGNVYISAKNSGSEVVISIEDDGRGLNKEKILQRALERGLITSHDDIGEDEILELIFQPGFSTKEETTEYSGRGVGLDIVKNTVQKIGGRIFVESEKDRGTRFTIRIPLTLAIIDGMLIDVDGNVFVVPLSSIVETFKLEKQQIVLENETPFVYRRGICFSVIDLNKMFYGKDMLAKGRPFYLGILVTNGEKHGVLLVDNMISQQQIVIKTLPAILKQVRGISGCTLLGSGNIAFILDIDALLER